MVWHYHKMGELFTLPQQKLPIHGSTIQQAPLLATTI